MAQATSVDDTKMKMWSKCQRENGHSKATAVTVCDACTWQLHQTSAQSSRTHPGAGGDRGLSQQLADRNTATEGHGQKRQGLCEGDGKKEPTPRKTGIKTDFRAADPENPHHSWCCRQKQTQIGDGQQRGVGT